MAFSEFRHLKDAEPGLKALSAAGVARDELRQRIASVMAGSRPAGKDGSQHVVPFARLMGAFVATAAAE